MMRATISSLVVCLAGLIGLAEPVIVAGARDDEVALFGDPTERADAGLEVLAMTELEAGEPRAEHPLEQRRAAAVPPDRPDAR